jgi:hypothetical protein
MHTLSKHERNFGIAIDGSEMSRIAFKTLLFEFLGKSDFLTLISITDSNKTYLSENFKPANIMLEYKNALVSNVSLLASVLPVQNGIQGKGMEQQGCQERYL